MRPKYTAEQRASAFWSKINKSGPIPSRRADLGPCWLWTASLNDSGYGKFRVTDDGGRRMVRAHRWAYELMIGPIHDDMELDHLCRTTACVNPAHLRVVTLKTNVLENSLGLTAENARKKYCKRGHLFDCENTYYQIKNGKRQRRCRECARVYNKTEERIEKNKIWTKRWKLRTGYKSNRKKLSKILSENGGR